MSVLTELIIVFVLTYFFIRDVLKQFGCVEEVYNERECDVKYIKILCGRVNKSFETFSKLRYERYQLNNSAISVSKIVPTFVHSNLYAVLIKRQEPRISGNVRTLHNAVCFVKRLRHEIDLPSREIKRNRRPSRASRMPRLKLGCYECPRSARAVSY